MRSELKLEQFSFVNNINAFRSRQMKSGSVQPIGRFQTFENYLPRELIRFGGRHLKLNNLERKA